MVSCSFELVSKPEMKPNRTYEPEPNLFRICIYYYVKFLLIYNFFAGNLTTPEGSVFILKSMRSATVTEVERIFDECYDCQSLYQLANILISDYNLPEGVKALAKPYLEKAVLALALEPDINLAEKQDLIEKLVCSNASLVSGSAETTALSLLLSEGLGPRTLACFVGFLATRTTLSSRHIPLLCSAARQHLAFINDHLETDEAVKITTQIEKMTSLTKRKKEDWANVAPYLLADILNTIISLEQPKVKQMLTSAAYNLLDICVSHSHEYLAANLPTATNEMFKVILQNYRANVKFTGRNV